MVTAIHKNKGCIIKCSCETWKKAGGFFSSFLLIAVECYFPRNIFNSISYNYLFVSIYIIPYKQASDNT